MNAYYITTPIYYVNDIPHIGHAYTTLAADVLARFRRLQGCDVKFLTGTDEHGQKVEKAASAAGLSPQDFVDQVSERFRDLATRMNFSVDDFIRTTQERHKVTATALWNRLVEKGQIYVSTYAGWYAVRDEAYYQEKELINGKAPTGADVEWVEEPSYFFKLSAFQEPLLKYYAEHPEFISPESRRNEVIRFVEGGLRDLSVSRSSFAWGVPVPGDDKHIMYVWIEALSNYLTAIDYPNIEGEDFQKYWPTCVHLVGKDILRFHAVYWPAILMAADLPLPSKIFAHGWWTNEGEKISKSLGNVIDPVGLIEQFGLDPVRYFLMREVPFGLDGDFSLKAMITRINADLANDLGNLVQRVLSFIQKNANAETPKPDVLLMQDKAMLEKVKALPTLLNTYADQIMPHKMCEAIWECISSANRYIDSEQPWALKKTDVDRMNTVLWVLCEVIRHVGVACLALMPESATKILDQLAIPQSDRNFEGLSRGPLEAGISLPPPQGVFPRIVIE